MSELKTPSKFTLGTVQLGLNYGMANTKGMPTKEEAFGVLDEAWNCNVRSLDTAVAYGESEQVIGEYLRKTGNPYFIASKFCLRGENAKKDLLRQVEHTKKHLQSVDLYMFHSAQELEKYGEQLEEPLRNLQQEGMTKQLGASIYELADIETFLKYEWLSAIQIPMSILDTRVVTSGLLTELKKRNVQVYVRSVFFQGLLCMDEIPEKYAFLTNYLGELREIAKSENMSLKEMAIAFIRDLQEVDSVVLGCESAMQVRDNSEIMKCAPISSSGRKQIMEIGRNIPIEKAMNIILARKG